MKKTVVCGAAGFIGGHLVKRLKADGCYVVGLDRKQPEFEKSAADEFFTTDLRRVASTDWFFSGVDEVYQLAAEVGGLGFIMDHDNDALMLRNSALINLHVLEACRQQKVPKIFFASSACVYPDLPGAPGFTHIGSWKVKDEPHIACRESDAYPAQPDNEYAWEKVFSERLYAAYALNYGISAHIGRLHNCFGTLGTWRGGREKAPAAVCRKVAEADNPGRVQVWGDGTQTRSFMYVDDAVEGIVRLMASAFQGPVNIGSAEMVSVDELVQIVAEIAGKEISINHIEGPVGVRGRNSDQTLIRQKLGWEPSIPLRIGLKATYKWISEQVEKSRLTVVEKPVV